jgi:hypothetical protein
MKLSHFLPLLLTPALALAQTQLIPAGATLSCTTGDGRISSKTVDVGDPILCQVHRLEVYGHQALPYGSYLSGYFEDYKDPGHLVGKGWMVLKFDRLIIAPGTVIPLTTRVVDVPKYLVDKEGKIRGMGHAKRDIITWAIPILWPIDLINLPRRGPRPTLRAETNITVKIMEDVEVPYFNIGQEMAPPQGPPPPPPTLIPRGVAYYPPYPYRTNGAYHIGNVHYSGR